MITKKIMLTSSFYQEDLKYVDCGDYELDVKNFQWLDENFLDEALKSDLVIFLLHGYYLHEMFNKFKGNRKFWQFIENKRVKKVVWSQDTHHAYLAERKIQHYFDTFYVSHLNYMDKLDAKNTYWLPCSNGFGSIDDLLHYNCNDNSFDYEYDVSMFFRLYAGLGQGERIAIAYKIAEILKKRKLKTFFGQINEVQPLARMIKKTKISLNLSLIDDLNLRNFEIIGLNSVMLANEVPNHKNVDLDYTKTVFFKRDLSDFEEKLDLAFLKVGESKNTVFNVLNKHMLIDRYLTIFNKELELGLVKREIGLKCNAIIQVDQTYTNFMLGLEAFFIEIRNKNFKQAVTIFDTIEKELKSVLTINIELRQKIFVTLNFFNNVENKIESEEIALNKKILCIKILQILLNEKIERYKIGEIYYLWQIINNLEKEFCLVEKKRIITLLFEICLMQIKKNLKEEALENMKKIESLLQEKLVFAYFQCGYLYATVGSMSSAEKLYRKFLSLQVFDSIEYLKEKEIAEKFIQIKMGTKK